MAEYLQMGFLIGMMVIIKTLIDCSIRLETLSRDAKELEKEVESKLSDIAYEIKQMSSGNTTFNVQQSPGDSFTVEQALCSSFKVELESNTALKVELDNISAIEVTPSFSSVWKVEPSYGNFKVDINNWP